MNKVFLISVNCVQYIWTGPVFGQLFVDIACVVVVVGGVRDYR